MNFSQLVYKVNALSDVNREKLEKIVNAIDITHDNFKEWADFACSKDVNKFDMEKLPYLIDTLYTSGNSRKVLLSFFLLQSTCMDLPFITNLENYHISDESLKLIKPILINIFEGTGNGIGICMVQILMNNDPDLELFNDEEKAKLASITKKYLKSVLAYFESKKANDIDPDERPGIDMEQELSIILEILSDFACVMDDDEISAIIDKIDRLEFFGDADLFIAKYKVTKGIELLPEKVERLSDPASSLLVRFYKILEDLDAHEKYLKHILQAQIACSNLVRWLEYPTELGEAPDSIECIGVFDYNDQRFFVFAFEKEGYCVEGKILGISGGYSPDEKTAYDSGFTFSKFEPLQDWKEQALSHIELIENHWKARYADMQNEDEQE